MVKGFDTTSSDPSKLLLDSIFSFFDSNRAKLTPEKAAIHLRDWLGSATSTSQIYKKFDHFPCKPKIIIHQQCPKPMFLRSRPCNGDIHFGAYEKNQNIHVCLDSIDNKIELKENVDRELWLLYYKMRKQGGAGEEDRTLIQNLYQSCQHGYRNYDWEVGTLKRAAKKCAVYLFRRRSASNLPPDALFRYSSKVADQFCI